ncbi:MAG: response regulator [Microcoleaceae cyanobacterium]
MEKPTIICVDDETVILKSLQIEMETAFADQCIYEFAESGREALEILDELAGEEMPIIVIVSDWLMPDMKGDDFLIKVHDKYPNVIKIMLTGQADQSAIENAQRNANLYSCLSKPWQPEELISILKRAMNDQHI